MKIKVGSKHSCFWLQISRWKESPTKQFLGMEGVWIFGHSVVFMVFGKHLLNPPKQKTVSSEGFLDEIEIFKQEI